MIWSATFHVMHMYGVPTKNEKGDIVTSDA